MGKTRTRRGGGGLVYSTEHGTMCPGCGKPIADCGCRTTSSSSGAAGIVRVARETKGRGGKGVTLIAGVPLDPGDLADLCRKLKKKCGTGGTIKSSVIEIQGDHRDKLVEELRNLGWTVKRSGG